jgi:catechol 2,3-dioxygenase-like lactoylglutathione lyase family enzyme
MAVQRIVPNIAAPELGSASGFYGDVLGMSVVMDLGWIITFSDPGATGQQISIATEGGSGAPVPDLPVEVDDFDDVLEAVRKRGFEVVYGPRDEPWGVRRFFVRDPFGRLVNILEHR